MGNKFLKVVMVIFAIIGLIAVLVLIAMGVMHGTMMDRMMGWMDNQIGEWHGVTIDVLLFDIAPAISQ